MGVTWQRLHILKWAGTRIKRKSNFKSKGRDGGDRRARGYPTYPREVMMGALPGTVTEADVEGKEGGALLGMRECRRD